MLEHHGTYLDIPPIVHCPWFMKAANPLMAVVFGNLLSIPNKMLDEARVINKTKAPFKKWTEPSFVCSLRILVRGNDGGLFKLTTCISEDKSRV